MGERADKLRAELEMVEAEEAFVELKGKHHEGKVSAEAYSEAKRELREKRRKFRTIREAAAAGEGVARPGTVKAKVKSG